MTDITVSREQAAEIFKALNGINELLKALPVKAENAAVMYAIISNIMVVKAALGTPLVSPN